MGVKSLFGCVFRCLKAVPAWFWYVFSMFVLTRAVLTVIGVISRKTIVLSSHAFKYTGIPVLDIWGVWDTEWFMRVATEGYSTQLYGGYASYGFFPLYPMLMRFFGGFFGSNYVAGLMISNISLFVACYYLYELVKMDDGEETAMRSIWYFFIFPSAFILSGVFSEALFLALLLACFYYARKSRWVLVGILGFFLSICRYIGFIAVLPLFFEYLKEKNFKLRGIKPDVLFLLLLPAGFLIYMFFLYHLTGDPLAYFHAQKSGWGFEVSNPLGHLFSMPEYPSQWVAKAAIIAGLALFVVFFRKLRFSYWFLGVYSILVPLSTGAIPGTLRYFAPIFPLFILFAKLGKNNYVNQLLTVVFALLQGFLMMFWTVGAPMIV
ncbi:MAG: hypothetical protein QXT19_02605 [Candidatus Woesearchaeota archaeon]